MVDIMLVEKLPEPTELGRLEMKPGRLLTWIEKKMISTPLILIGSRRELIINPRELPGLMLRKLLEKRLGRQNQPHGTGRKVNQMHQLQSLLIRKRELGTNWVNSTIQGQSLIGLK